MIKNYFKVAWRNLLKNKTTSLVNICGLAAGMAVTMIIGLWVWNELSFNKSFQNNSRIAQVMQNNKLNGEVQTWRYQPLPLAAELRNKYGSDFSHVLIASGMGNHILAYGDKKIIQRGNFIESSAPEMLTMEMLHGNRHGLEDPNSILLSESLSIALFGDASPVDKVIRMDDQSELKVTGVYQDFPENSTFHETSFMAPWEYYYANNDWVKEMNDSWTANVFQVYVQLAPNADIGRVSEKIRLAKWNKQSESAKQNKSELFLFPMSKWHLYSTFRNGVNDGGRIEFVWLFGIIGFIVLLLACINFVNLSTARSENRAKEVGIRKAIGSNRKKLIGQFLCESLLVAVFAFALAIGLLCLLIPFFNQATEISLYIPWNQPIFWSLGIGFVIITGIIAGSYPAFYLSSFQAINMLKGAVRSGRFSTLPRKVLVVFQFSVSIILIIGTLVVFRQVEYAKHRPIGYNREGLIMAKMLTEDIHDRFDVFRNELIKSGAVANIAESSAPPTGIWATDGGFEWQGKDPNISVDFPNTGVSYDYGQTVGWQFISGRDFSREFSTDSSAFVINEAAARFMGLKDPVGKTIKWDDQPFQVIGVIKDVVVESPFQPVRPSIFSIKKNHDNYLVARLNPTISPTIGLAKIEAIFKVYSPATPFDYHFVDEEYAKKFFDEERIGKLATSFAIFAILISCLGLFGMASFIAGKRVKEIGVRKVLGASVFSLWRLLSREFIILVFVALFIGIPISYYFMHQWLLSYSYRTEISWKLIALAATGAVSLTMLTVSFQTIRAANLNPVNSLKTE